ncbi:MAG: S1 RNA-binding domain-containing protein [Ruminococcus sp.]|nr:S1 RNA-binding domain-containing protein [Ruminococcus sp.]
MQVEVGSIYEGTVKNITNYGMFVNIDNPENERVVGMVHISEISRKYVNDIHEFVSEGEQVCVKCIGVNPQGKISLSMKQLKEPESRNDNAVGRHAGSENSVGYKQHGDQEIGREGRENDGQTRERRSGGGKPNIYEPKKRQEPSEMTFEDMLSKFKQNSEERMCDIKRNMERKNRSRRK